jgi:hypothetical protein
MSISNSIQSNSIQNNSIQNYMILCNICESDPHITPDCSICNESLCTCACEPCQTCTYHFDFCNCDQRVVISHLKKKKEEE